MKKEIDTLDREGIFVVLAEGKKQAPIVMETEGADTSFESARLRSEQTFWSNRVCICRLVPVYGNDLLALDMMRMQVKKEDTL